MKNPGAKLLLEPGLCALLVVATALKLALLATTIGTNDAYACFRFGVFAHDHTLAGSYSFFGGELNHPPLGLFLMADAIELWRDVGLDAFFWLRLPALAGEIYALVAVSELLADRLSPRDARTVLALLIASPLGFAEVYHGNTDPLWIAFVLFSTLELERGRAARAGALAAIAVAIKLPATCALAPLAVVAWREGRLSRFAGAFLAITAPIFGATMLAAGEPFVRSVFGYRGTVTHQPWGLVSLLDALGSTELAEDYRRVGGPLALGVSVASALAFRRRGRAGEAVIVALASLLALAPVFGVQYLAWLAAPVGLLGVRAIASYHATAALQALLLYASWGAFRAPYFADSQSAPGTPSGLPAAATWIVVAAVTVSCLRRSK
jgi:hypothetical protein